MLTSNERAWFDRREDLTEHEAQILEFALDDLAYRSRLHSMPMAQDDRLAALEAAFVRYLIESRTEQAKAA